MEASTPNNRWRDAQKAAAKSWESNPQPIELSYAKRRANLEIMCRYTSLSEEQLENMRVLEIGGSIIEAAFDDVNIAPKLSLDPVFFHRRLIGQWDKSCHRVKGVGEYLPLPDRSIDLCWCANVIDHTFSPVKGVSRDPASTD